VRPFTSDNSSKFAGTDLKFDEFRCYQPDCTRLHRVRRRAVEVDALPSDTRVLEADVACPMAIGLGKPAIVLPHGFRDAVGRDELRDVLTHKSDTSGAVTTGSYYCKQGSNESWIRVLPSPRDDHLAVGALFCRRRRGFSRIRSSFSPHACIA
jgi:hypothetical protein